MDDGVNLDRLLPRHPLGENRVQIAWDVRPARRLSRRGERLVMGTIVDLSLDGALVEVPAAYQHAVGDSVSLRFGGIEGRATVRHRHDADDSVRYGVQWSGSADLRAVVERAVGVVRGHNAELRSHWERDHR